jgi:polyhydroxybutyrate depolymerase
MVQGAAARPLDRSPLVVGAGALDPPSVATTVVSHRRRKAVKVVSAPIPIGAHPGHGRPVPVVLSPAAELAAIGRLPPGWGASVHTVRRGSLTRSYLVVAPHAAYRDRTLPLYVVLHGRGSNPAAIERRTGLAWRTGPAVLVYPAGYEDSWNAGGCCGYAHADGVNDVSFVHAVVATVLSEYPAASSRRVYALGFSNGGRMTYRLACDLPGMFAGIAAVEAVPVMACSRLHPLDIDVIAQRRDPLLSIYDGSVLKMTDGYLQPTVEAAVARWRSLDGCAPAAVTTSIGDATVRTWACGDGTHLAYTLYQGGGHIWPLARPGQPSADGVILSSFAPVLHRL